jgi:cytochrome c551/c552
MNAARYVYTSFAAATVAILTLAACGARGPKPGTPEALYVELGCAKCHGDARQGLRSGPPLVNLKDRWQEDELVAYLQNPKAVMEREPRLAYIAEQYPIAMPAFVSTDEAKLRDVAGFILSKSDS